MSVEIARVRSAFSRQLKSAVQIANVIDGFACPICRETMEHRVSSLN